MTAKTAPDKFRHRIPADIAGVLRNHRDVVSLWEKLTPLSRNEWICWVTIVKTQKTRSEHLVRLVEDLRAGKKRPCCWPGCPHRRPQTMKYFSKKQ